MFFAVKPVITLPAETAETSPSFRLGSHLLVAAVPLNGAPVFATVHPTLTKCPRRGSKLQGQLWKSWDWLMTCVKSPNMCYWISFFSCGVETGSNFSRPATGIWSFGVYQEPIESCAQRYCPCRSAVCLLLDLEPVLGAVREDPAWMERDCETAFDDTRMESL